MYILILKHAAYIFVHFIGVFRSNFFLFLSQVIAVSTWYLLHMTAQKVKWNGGMITESLINVR